MRTKLLNLALALILSSAALSASAAPTYTFNILESLGGTSNAGWANSINNSGQIIGTSNNLATYWSSNNPSAPTLLQSPTGYNNSEALSINNSGQIVGARFGQDGGYWAGGGQNNQGVVWGSPTSQTVLEAIAISGGDPFIGTQTRYTSDAYPSYAAGVNDSGQIVGRSTRWDNTSPDYIWRATLWNSTSPNSPIQLESLGGSQTMGEAFGINNSGQIVGTSGHYYDGDLRATLWSSANPSSPQELVALAGAGMNSWAGSINNNGQIVGESISAEGWSNPTLWNSSNPNTPEMLEALGGMGYGGWARSINNNGQIVGFSFNASDLGRATLWDGTNSPVDLNNYLDQASRNAGWILTQAMDINDSGSIVGIASNSLLGITSQAFLLQSVAAVPEADTSAMLLMGAGVMGFMARRRKQVAA